MSGIDSRRSSLGLGLNGKLSQPLHLPLGIWQEDLLRETDK